MPMDRTRWGTAVAACGIAWSGAAAGSGADGTGTSRFASITLENDFFMGSDSHYTNGFQAAVLVDRQSLPRWLEAVPPIRWSADPEIMFALGQRIYTPTNTDSFRPDPTDRPYAGWLYLMVDVMTRSDEVIDHASLSVGVIGPPSLGRQAQNGVHRLTRTNTANGWDSQLGTEPTLMLGYERAWPGILRGSAGDWDVTLRWGAALGTPMTYANAGLVARWGRNLPADVPVTHISLGPPRDGYRGSSHTGWYAWLGLDGRAVARNAFIDGNLWKDSPGVERKPQGYDVALGAAVAWRTGRFGFTFIRRSAEFKGQKGADRFGQLTLSLPY